MAIRRAIQSRKRRPNRLKGRFSYREAARLQGFPASLVFPDTAAGSLDMRYKVVGNAVPPPLFEAVARALPNVWR